MLRVNDFGRLSHLEPLVFSQRLGGTTQLKRKSGQNEQEKKPDFLGDYWRVSDSIVAGYPNRREDALQEE